MRAPTTPSAGDLSSFRRGQVQLYFRDPAGNLIELNWPDAATLDRERTRSSSAWPTTCRSPQRRCEARLYLEPGEAAR